MLTNESIQSLAKLIHSATEQAQQLTRILQDEQQVLLMEDYDNLESLIEQKLTVSQTLDHLERQRQEIMVQAGYETDNGAMADYLSANTSNQAIKPLVKSWDRLMGGLKTASDQNQLNGILLEKQRQHVKRALNILFEQSPNTDVYDASGGTAQPKYTRSVGVV